MLGEGEVHQNVKARVMVVDDSAGMRSVTRSLLEKAGYAVETALDGFEALSRIVEIRPQLILIDTLIPRVNGFQACAVIKQNPQFAAIPVILLGASDRLFDRVRARMVGASQYLQKPFSREDLLEMVRHYLGKESIDSLHTQVAS